MADARRIVFGTQVTPVQNDAQENPGQFKYTLDHNRIYGGKGIVSISANQWGGNSGWTSMSHDNTYWESQGSNWEDEYSYWTGIATISISTALCPDASVASTPVAFLYIKNLGGTALQALQISTNGGAAFTMYLKAGGSVCLRGDGTNLVMSDVRVDKIDSPTSIEFIIAN